MAETCNYCTTDGNVWCTRCGGKGTMLDGSTCYICKGECTVKCPICAGTKVKK